MAQLTEQGCTLVDTTCGSVLNVWKNVIRYAQDGFTAIIHGKVKHEETRATASQALKYPERPVSRRARSRRSGIVCDYIRNGGDAAAFIARFGGGDSPGFDPDLDPMRVGCANQTTMLMTESLGIGEMFRAAIPIAMGPKPSAHFRAFDTICSATQERQDAVIALLNERAARSDAGRRRLQQQQHLQSGADLRRTGAHVPHRRPRLPDLARRDPPPSGRAPRRPPPAAKRSTRTGCRRTG